MGNNNQNKKQWEYSTNFFTIKSYKDRIYISGSLDKKCLPGGVTEEMCESMEEVCCIIDCILRFGIASARNQKEFDQRMLDILKMKPTPEVENVPEGLENYIIEMPMGEGNESRRGVWAFDCSEEKKQQTLDELRAMGAKIIAPGA